LKSESKDKQDIDAFVNYLKYRAVDYL